MHVSRKTEIYLDFRIKINAANVAIFILERNLIGTDYDHMLGNHF